MNMTEKMFKARKNIGPVEFKTGKVYIGDPYYEEFDDKLVEMSIKPGTYKSSILQCDGDNKENSYLILTSLTEKVELKDFIDINTEIYLESGTAGIFDTDSYNDERLIKSIETNSLVVDGDSFYKAMRSLALSSNYNNFAGSYTNGCVSVAGYQKEDYYKMSIALKNGEIIGLILRFIDKEAFYCTKCGEEIENDTATSLCSNCYDYSSEPLYGDLDYLFS